MAQLLKQSTMYDFMSFGTIDEYIAMFLKLKEFHGGSANIELSVNHELAATIREYDEK